MPLPPKCPCMSSENLLNFACTLFPAKFFLLHFHIYFHISTHIFPPKESPYSTATFPAAASPPFKSSKSKFPHFSFCSVSVNFPIDSWLLSRPLPCASTTQMADAILPSRSALMSLFLTKTRGMQQLCVEHSISECAKHALFSEPAFRKLDIMGRLYVNRNNQLGKGL